MFNKNKTGNNEITKKPLSKKIKDFISALRKGSKVFSALTMLQLKEAIENKSKGNKKKLIQIIVFTVVKFVLVAGVTLGIIMILNYIGLLALSEMVKFYVLILTLLLVLTLFSCVNNLTKSLYYSEDNKVLVTFPVSSSSLFISKIGVFFVFELKRAFDAIIPITFGFVLTAVIMGVVNVGALFWCWFPLIAAILVVVLLASVLSVPYLYILQFLKKYPLIELLLILGIIGGVITGIVFLINLIPANIDLVASWPKIKADLNKGLDQALIYLYPFDKLVRSMFGDVVATSIQWQLTSSSFAVYGIYLASAVGLFAINLLLLKPFYFVMMTKTFEYEKDVLDVGKKNKVHKRYITFTNKELKITFRDIEVSGSYIAVYIITPLLLLFLDAIFSAITTKLEGDLMTYAFNIL